MGHRGDPVHEVAEVVRQIRVVPLVEALPRKVAVLAVDDLLGEIQSEGVGTQPVGRLEGIDDGPERLAHALALPVHPAVTVDRPRQLDARAHEHRRPHHRVEAGDVLAHHVQVGRPPPRELLLVGAVPDRGHVVGEGVEPDVDNVRRVERQGNAPALPGPADGDVLEAALEQPQHLVAPDLGLHEVRVGRVVRQQPVPVAGQAEDVVLLLEPVRFAAVHRAFAVDEVLVLLEGLARDAVPPLVLALVEVAGGGDALDEGRHRHPVALLGGADEVVERHVELGPDLAEHPLHPVAEGQRIEPELGRALEDVLRVLVVAHHEARGQAAQTAIAGDDVGRHLLVGRAQVGPAVDVVDSRGQIEAAHLCCTPTARRGPRGPRAAARPAQSVSRTVAPLNARAPPAPLRATPARRRRGPPWRTRGARGRPGRSPRTPGPR